MTSYNSLNIDYVTHVTKLFYLTYVTNKYLFSISFPGFHVFML